MKDIWTDAEEINAIIGLFVGITPNSLLYDYLNESEFNLCVNRKVRVAHKSNYYTRVPYALLSLIKNG